MIVEYDNGAAPASPSREYIYAGSQLLATIDSSGTKYHMNDHLSPRLTTDSGGNKIGEQGHYPFGDSWYSQSTTTKWQFTSYEHDSESGNDYAMMRSYVNRVGRFSSADRLAGSLGDPQSLNRYAYSGDDAINLTDPSGNFYGPGMPFFGAGDDARGLVNWFGAGVEDINAEAQIFARTGGGGGGPLNLGPAPQPPPPPISDACKKALQTAGVGGSLAASVLGAVTAQWVALQAAANYQGIDPSILASVAIRESGMRNVPQQGGPGHGHGEFQLDENTYGSPIPGWAYNPQFAAVAAAGQLRMNARYFQVRGYGPWGQLAGALHAYNHGFQDLGPLRGVDDSGLSQFADRGTANNNYVSNVLAIARECFGFPQ